MATTKKNAKANNAKPAAKSAAKTSGKGSPAAKSAKADPKGDASKRKLGLRGAAPWAARHAAKHAAEARARAAEPPLPGSARATIRTPQGAEDIKQKIADLHNALTQIKALRKNLVKNFFEIGEILKDVQAKKLYVAKGFGTYEAFLEREIDFGKTMALRLVKIVNTFLREAAMEYGLDRLVNALISLEIPPEAKSEAKIPAAPLSAPTLPLKPPGR